jgi:hypothetical protein
MLMPTITITVTPPSRNPSWAEIVEARNRREDEAIARRYAQWANLGRGHLREDLCWRPRREY